MISDCIVEGRGFCGIFYGSSMETKSFQEVGITNGLPFSTEKEKMSEEGVMGSTGFMEIGLGKINLGVYIGQWSMLNS
jgi:hypothetical protein